MLNTVNKLKIIGTKKEVLEVLNFIKYENGKVGTLDFNKINPMPLWVHQGRLGKEELEKYGEENCWLGWKLKNWGTKYNARNQKFEEPNFIEFCTENAVPDLIKKLSIIFPNVVFRYAWSINSEHFNAYMESFKNGEIIDKLFCKENSEEAFLLENYIFNGHITNEYMSIV